MSPMIRVLVADDHAVVRAGIVALLSAEADIDVVGWDAKRAKVKLNPLAAWTFDDVERYAVEHEVLMNPLRQLGYASIGCEPCTRAVAPGEDPRAGRWAGSTKTECGLHA